jgi:hypothetical protein
VGTFNQTAEVKTVPSSDAATVMFRKSINAQYVSDQRKDSNIGQIEREALRKAMAYQ